MSVVSYSTIRQRFATQIETIPDFKEIRSPFDGLGRSPNTVAHYGFAVSVRGSVSRDDDRQRRGQGIMMSTDVSVRFAYRIRPKDQIESFDDGFDLAQTVIESLTDRSSPLHDSLTIRFVSIDNQLANNKGEYVLFTLNFSVLHYINL